MAERRRWEFAGAWLLAGLFGLELSRILLSREPALPDARLWATLASQGLWVGLALALATLTRGGTVTQRLGLGPGRLGAARVALLALGLLALSDGLSALLSALQVRETGALGEVQAMVDGAREAPSFGLALLALGVVPGLAEELLFRGALLRALAGRLGWIGGVGISAALFGLAHGDPVQTPAALVLGLYLGAVAVLAGSVRAAMACHVANNLLATLSARLGSPSLPVDPLLGAPVGVLAGVAILVWVWRRAGGPASTSGEGPPGDPGR